MNVLMVTPMLPYPETLSAGPLGMYETWQMLRERHEVTLLTFAGPDPVERAAIERLRREGNDLQVVWRAFGPGLAHWQRRARMASAWASGLFPLRTLEFWERDMQRLIDRTSARQRFDILQIEDNAMAVYHYPALPMVLTEHEVRTAEAIAPTQGASDPAWRRALRAAEWRRWRRYQRRVWGRADRVQVFTERDAANVRALLPATRVRVNPFGVHLPPLPAERWEDDRSVVFVGGFNHAPNVDAALWLADEIMPLLRHEVPGVRLTIVGNQPPPAVVQRARDDVIVTGRVPAIEPYLDRAAVVIAPLRLGGGMRMKVVQAMAHAKALVTTPLGAEGLHVAGHAPPLLLGDDAATLARHTVALLTDPQRRRDLGDRARAFVRDDVSWERYGARLEAIYGELTTDHRPPTTGE